MALISGRRVLTGFLDWKAMLSAVRSGSPSTRRVALLVADDVGNAVGRVTPSASDASRLTSSGESAADRSSKVKASAGGVAQQSFRFRPPRCAVCEAGRVSTQGRQRTSSLARFRLALFTTKPAPKKERAAHGSPYSLGYMSRR
jgi:hypothetical protein